MKAEGAKDERRERKRERGRESREIFQKAAGSTVSHGGVYLQACSFNYSPGRVAIRHALAVY